MTERAGILLTTDRIRIVCVLFYLGCNLYALYFSLTYGELIGDFHNQASPDPIVSTLVFLSVAGTYFLVLFPIFDYLTRLTNSSSELYMHPLWPVGATMAMLQISFFAFSQATGVGVAGTFARPDSPLRFIFYFVPIDYLSLIYLVLSKNIYWVLINGALYLGSGLGRGWSAGLILVALVVVSRLSVDRHRIRTAYVVAAGVGVALATPLIFAARALVRERLEGIEAAWQYFLASTVDGNIYGYLFHEIAGRFQHYSSVAYIFLHRGGLRDIFDSGGIREFWFDGSYGQALLTLFTRPAPEFGLAMTAFAFGFDPATNAYNVHIGLLSWPILVPELIIPYLAYLLLLGLASLLLVRWAGGDRRLLTLTWFMWVLLLMNGWFGGFVAYISALGLVALLRYIGLVVVLPVALAWPSRAAKAGRL